MNLVYFADGPWAQRGLVKMIAAGHLIQKIYLRYDNPDPELQKLAEGFGIQVEIVQNVNAPEHVESIRQLEAPLGVSLSFNQIIKKGLLNVFPEGMINIHAGKLPLYRGRNVLNWALINGEKEIGITCHFMDEGIDSGDIILQRSYPIKPNDDYRSILEKAYEWCSDLLIDSLTLMDEDKVVRKVQPRQGTYYVGRVEGDEFIDWDWSSEQIFNFVRAITIPGPCARTWLRYQGRYIPLVIKQVALSNDLRLYRCVTGAVIGKTDAGHPIVKTKDSAVVILDYEIPDCEEAISLKTGDRLGININLMLNNIMGALNHERLCKSFDL